MLNIKTTKTNTGITISGDYSDLTNLYDALSNLAGHEGQVIGYDSVTLRILGLCYDIRHALMGDREIELIDNGITDETKKWHGKLYPDFNLYYSFNILWIEAIFSVLAIEDLINIYSDVKLLKKHINNENIGDWIKDDEKKNEHIKNFRLEREIQIPYDIAIAKLYQALIWNALVDVIGINRYRRLKKALLDDYSRFYIPLKYKGFCTQYLDMLNINYLDSKPEKRPTLLSSYIRTLIDFDQEYYEIERDIRKYAKENGINESNIRITGIEYPDKIEW